VVAVWVFVDGEPFVGTHADVFVGFKLITMLDDMHVLYTVAVACAQNGTDVLGLTQIFQYYSDMTGTVLQNLGQPCLAAFGDKLLKILNNAVSQMFIFYFYHFYIIKKALFQGFFCVLRNNDYFISAKAAPGLNLTTFFAGILMDLPVEGL